jgi:ribosomal protein L37E
MRNSTILVKKKRCINCGKMDYHFSKKMCKQCATIASTQKRMDEFEEDGESFQNLVQDLDAIFSQYIRNKHADKNGIVECYTCGNKHTIVEIQCGHFMGRTNLGTRWMEQNCRPQCMECNYFKTGNIEEFENKLNEENGSLVEYLRETARQPVRPTREELKHLIIEYRSKLVLVKKKLTKSPS